MKRGAVAALALALGACRATPIGSSAARPTAPDRCPSAPPAVGAAPLIVTMWCGPPLDRFDDTRAAEVAAAGFTAVGPPCEGPRSAELNRRALAVAARHGLTLWLADHRFGIRAPDDDDWQAHLRAAVSEYRHPALGAYFVFDEPGAPAFDRVAALVDALREADPTRPAYVNLLPDYLPPDALGAGDYAGYLDGFLDRVRPALLSVDYYPFLVDGDRPSFHANLALLRDRALARDLPFMLIVQAMPHGPYRDPTAGELAWQLFHAMAYGARGVSYFAYWTPVAVELAERWRFRAGVIEHGRPTDRYAQVARLNRELRAIGAALAGHRSVGVVLAGAPPAASDALALDGGPATVGLFRDRAGREAALVVNDDYRAARRLRARARGGGRLEVLEPDSGCWRPAPPILILPAGGARLVRW
jgi:hypothetical protein